MKTHSRFLALFLLCVTNFSLLLQAEIVSINFQKVFETYPELKMEDQKLRQEVAAFQQAQNEKVQALQAQQQQFNAMRNQAAQPGLSADERKKLVGEATTSLEALNKEEQAIREERAQFQKDIEAKGLRLRRIIVDKVNAKVAEIAEEKEWEMVLDSSAKSPNGLPVIAYVTETKDQTDFVIRELMIEAQERAQKSAPKNDQGTE
ncbi:OmpH family outer membrane protein [Kiritimatiellota bacterium B12222]|nr:OmpH family outer membrane protein [Kiritimatiellota bacterium B12222]